MFLAAFVAFVIEYPRFDTIRYFSLSQRVDRKARRGKDPAIIIATRLRAIFINRAFIVHQHGAVTLVAIAHEHMPLGQAGGGKQKSAGDPFDGLRFFRLDIDEHRRTATTYAV